MRGHHDKSFGEGMGMGCCGGGHKMHFGHHGFNRHFISKEERTERLEKYRESLEKEIQGIDEYLDELKSK